MPEPIRIYFDGGSRGNPGPAAGAAFADYEGGRERVCFIESATNNEAEYRGLLMAIELARELKLTEVQFLGDSKLVVMQINGEWQAKHEMMAELKQEALRALTRVPQWTIAWIPREKNAEADRVANQEMDKRMGIVPVPIIESNHPVADVPAAAAIRKLNGLGAKAGFGELRKLKVGGSDAFSRITFDSLAETLVNFNELEHAFTSHLRIDKLTSELTDEARSKLLLNALRWSARGLQGDLALKKVLVDLEMANSMRGKKK